MHLQIPVRSIPPSPPPPPTLVPFCCGLLYMLYTLCWYMSPLQP